MNKTKVALISGLPGYGLLDRCGLPGEDFVYGDAYPTWDSRELLLHLNVDFQERQGIGHLLLRDAELLRDLPLLHSPVDKPPERCCQPEGVDVPAVGAEITLVIIALAAFMVVVVVYASRQKLESQKHNLEAAVKRATRPVAPRLKVPVFVQAS